VFQPAAQKRGQRMLDRGWGKPKENVELPDAEPRQITHIVREETPRSSRQLKQRRFRSITARSRIASWMR
jgi:hypothetical protein